MWDRFKFEKVADTIADDYLNRGRSVSINDLSFKIATDNHLNPEQIRTMVRLANVSAFQRVFDKKGSNNDDMLEFEPGDPEVVIQKLYSEAKTAADKSSYSWDEVSRVKDLYSDLYPKKQVIEKVAQVETVEVDVDVSEIKLLIKNAADQLTIDAHRAEFRWHDAMEKAANVYRLKYSKKYNFDMCDSLHHLEKDALVTLGEDIEPELRYLSHCMCGNSLDHPLYNGEKVANILDRHIAIPDKETQEMFQFLKEARDARYSLKECNDSRRELRNQLERVNALR